MEFLNKIEINRHEVIKERGKHFAESLEGEDKKQVLSIVEKSERYLKTIGDQDNVVYSPTGLEVAAFKRAVKRYVQTDFRDEATSRLRQVSLALEDIDGICNECIRNEENWEYEMCDSCEEKLDFIEQIYYVQNKRWGKIKNDFDNAVEEMDFSDELIGNWLLLMRKMREDKKSKHIDNALKEFIRDELIKEFRNQNEQLLKKYQLWQNQ